MIKVITKTLSSTVALCEFMQNNQAGARYVVILAALGVALVALGVAVYALSRLKGGM